MRTGGSPQPTAETETVDPGMNGITDTTGVIDRPIDQTIDPPHLSIMVETTGMHVQHAHLVGIAICEVVGPRNPPVPTLREKKASEYRKFGQSSLV